MKRAVEVRSRKCTLEKLPASNFMKEKLGKEGLDNNTLITIHKLGGVRGLLSILALPKMFSHIKSKTKQKPRVTKDLKVLTKVVNYFSANV